MYSFSSYVYDIEGLNADTILLNCLLVPKKLAVDNWLLAIPVSKLSDELYNSKC